MFFKENLGNPACLEKGEAASGNMYWTSGQQLQKNCKSPYIWALPDNKLMIFDFKSWGTDQPDCYYPSEDYCVNIQVFDDFRWSDKWCRDKFCPLCEYTP